MTKGELAKIYTDWLSAEGYPVRVDEDGDLMLKIEGMTYFIILDEDDETYFTLVFPSFWPIESEDERRKAERAALEVTSSVKVAKVFIRKDQMFATIELFCPSPEAATAVVPRSIRALQRAVRDFVKIMQA